MGLTRHVTRALSWSWADSIQQAARSSASGRPGRGAWLGSRVLRARPVAVSSVLDGPSDTPAGLVRAEARERADLLPVQDSRAQSDGNSSEHAQKTKRVAGNARLLLIQFLL